jgi:p21-activated kinase 1
LGGGGGDDGKDLPDKPKGRERSGTGKSREGKKSVFGFMTGEFVVLEGSSFPCSLTLNVSPASFSALDLLNTNKQVVISTPYDPVHLTHVGFNSDTGECELERDFG